MVVIGLPTATQEIRRFALWDGDMPHRFRQDNRDTPALRCKPRSRVCSGFTTSNYNNLPLSFRIISFEWNSVEDLLVPWSEL